MSFYSGANMRSHTTPTTSLSSSSLTNTSLNFSTPQPSNQQEIINEMENMIDPLREQYLALPVESVAERQDIQDVLDIIGDTLQEMLMPLSMASGDDAQLGAADDRPNASTTDAGESDAQRRSQAIAFLSANVPGFDPARQPGLSEFDEAVISAIMQVDTYTSPETLDRMAGELAEMYGFMCGRGLQMVDGHFCQVPSSEAQSELVEQMAQVDINTSSETLDRLAAELAGLQRLPGVSSLLDQMHQVDITTAPETLSRLAEELASTQGWTQVSDPRIQALGLEEWMEDVHPVDFEAEEDEAE